MLKRVLVSLLSVVSIHSWASTAFSTIDKVVIYDTDALVYVYPAGGKTKIGCHERLGEYYSFSLTRPYAKEYLSSLLAAQARQAKVTIYGAGDCIDQDSSETLHYISIEQ